MVSLIGVPLEQVKNAFVEWAKDCKNFKKILDEEKDKSSKPNYTSDIIDTSILRFEKEYNGLSVYSSNI